MGSPKSYTSTYRIEICHINSITLCLPWIYSKVSNSWKLIKHFFKLQRNTESNYPKSKTKVLIFLLLINLNNNSPFPLQSLKIGGNVRN